MDNIFTPEEAARHVTYAELLTIIKVMSETVAEAENKIDEMTLESISKVTDALIERLESIEYKRVRDVYFFINMLSSLGYMKKERIHEYYLTYCDEFDKLNKN